MCVSVDGTAVKSLALKFLVIMEITGWLIFWDNK